VLLAQHGGQFDKGDVCLSRDRGEDDVAKSFNPARAPVAALGLGAG
jgi:hypothetical protein